jgi:hypothetical protein
MAIRPQDLNFTKNADAAESLAAFIWDAANALEHASDGTARTATQIRVGRRAAKQLLELHDPTPGEVPLELKASTINGHVQHHDQD